MGAKRLKLPMDMHKVATICLWPELLCGATEWVLRAMSIEMSLAKVFAANYGDLFLLIFVTVPYQYRYVWLNIVEYR